MSELNNNEVEEGGNCLDPQCDGVFYVPDVEGCYCHVCPLCSACVNNELLCNKCDRGEEELKEVNN